MPGSNVAIAWATKFLMATAKVLAQRLAALNKETISIMAQLEKSGLLPSLRSKTNWSGFGGVC